MDTEFTALLERDVGSLGETACRVLAEHAPPSAIPSRVIEAAIAAIDRRLSEQLNLILHHADFQRMEATWRGLSFLVDGIENGFMHKIKVLDISKQELGRNLRKFRGTAWDQSPLFKKIYEEEYGQFGGEPYGVLIGDYPFDHRPQDVQLLGDIAQIAAAAHAPFIAAAAPTVMQMESWGELANPRDLTRIFQTPEYAAWRAMRETRTHAISASACRASWPACLRRASEPLEAFDFESRPTAPTPADISGSMRPTRWRQHRPRLLAVRLVHPHPRHRHRRRVDGLRC